MKARFWIIGILICLLAGLCSGQVSSDSYRIQVDDRLAIQVFDENQIAAEVVVTPDGKISAPFAGIIVAAGKTTSELEAELADIYEKKLRLRSPKVSVTIRSVRKILATVGGQVQRPNTYEMRPGQTVRDLIFMGGVDVTIGDLRRATFRRKSWSETIPLDIYSMVTTGNLSQNYKIEDGDEVVVPPKKDYTVRIFGQVNQPRTVEYQEGMDLVTAITTAGGPTSQQSKQTKVMVIRPKPGTIDQYLFIECDLVSFYKKRDASQNIKLMPKDTVYVPSNGNPDFSLFNSVANALFILDRIGLGFGFLKSGG